MGSTVVSLLLINGIVFLLVLGAFGHCNDETLVQTVYGPVRGRIRAGHNNTKFFSFQGIPYAQPPIGELRFKDPKPPQRWIHTFDATTEGPSAVATDLFNRLVIPDGASEDCLRLNVFTKHSNAAHSVPVMVWIHGGGFAHGSSADSLYGPDFFMRKDIVLVTINYRLGALGFLSISDKKFKIPGNAGLKDQTMALRWVRKNIARFGGNPDNVTVFGNDAGGASVHYHLMSDFSRGLFNRAIIQSGSALNPWASRVSDNNLNERLAKRLGWTGTGGMNQMLAVLQKADAKDLAYAQEHLLTAEELQRGLLFAFTPLVEPYNHGSSFVTKSLAKLSKKGWGQKVPLLIGGNSEDGFLLFDNFIKKAQVLGSELYFGNALPNGKTAEISACATLADELRQFYFGDEQLESTNVNKLVPLLTDKLFWQGISRTVRDRALRKKAATYLYRFSFDSQVLTYMKYAMTGKLIKGTVHAEELQYMFKIANINDHLLANSSDSRIIDIFINVWTQFAATSNPYADIVRYVNWPPITNATEPLRCLNIDSDLRVMELPETKRIAFWDSLRSRRQ